MQFTTVLALVLPLVAALPQEATSTTSAPATSSTPDLEAICESQASSYADACPRCLYRCTTSSVPDQCFYSTFFAVNGIQADCEQHGGSNCRNLALNDVCPQ
ncbi:hypothetical protein HD806DRAFT_529176 [Xylariaceae sp. AK1471]|nr:hypothetical protein HD806DRAFT_529176 [Xylariaceae sp. AK1471]